MRSKVSGTFAIFYSTLKMASPPPPSAVFSLSFSHAQIHYKRIFPFRLQCYTPSRASLVQLRPSINKPSLFRLLSINKPSLFRLLSINKPSLFRLQCYTPSRGSLVQLRLSINKPSLFRLQCYTLNKASSVQLRLSINKPWRFTREHTDGNTFLLLRS